MAVRGAAAAGSQQRQMLELEEYRAPDWAQQLHASMIDGPPSRHNRHLNPLRFLCRCPLIVIPLAFSQHLCTAGTHLA